MMAITPPVAGQEISASGWGIPISNLVNTLEARAVTHYVAVLGSPATFNTGAAVPILTIAMPATPAGTKLDISFTMYANSGPLGHGGGFINADVNGTDVSPTVVIPDIIALASWSGRVVNVSPPVNVAYNVRLKIAKYQAGGGIVAQTTNTNLCVVAYRP